MLCLMQPIWFGTTTPNMNAEWLRVETKASDEPLGRPRRVSLIVEVSNNHVYAVTECESKRCTWCFR